MSDIPQIRYIGPYRFRGQWRCQIINAESRTWLTPQKTRDRAERNAEQVIAQVMASRPVTVREAIERYAEHLRQIGNKPASYEGTPLRLRCFFAKVLSLSVRSLTAVRCAAIYDELRSQVSKKTGRPLAVATHKAYLLDARTFASWAVEQKLMSFHPLEKIKPVGRVNARKAQHRHSEARRLCEVCYRLAPADDGALAVLLGLIMGLRAGEIVTRTVRDLDDDGRILWVDDVEGWSPKTTAARRRIEVPAPLLPLLLQRARGRSPDALLFPAKRGARHDRGWVRLETKRLCTLAEVPIVCAHSLRGFHATTAVAAGVSPHTVAAAMGHESASITLASYAAPGTAELASRRHAAARLLPGASPVVEQPS